MNIIFSGSVGVRSSSLAEGLNNIHKASVVLHATLGPAGPLFLLLLLVNLNRGKGIVITKQQHIMENRWALLIGNVNFWIIPWVFGLSLYQHEPKNHGPYLK
jgi:hypothetical protein